MNTNFDFSNFTTNGKKQTLHWFFKENSTTKSHFCKENKLLEGKKRLLSLFFSYETFNFQKKIVFFIIIIISLRIFFSRNLNWILIFQFLFSGIWGFAWTYDDNGGWAPSFKGWIVQPRLLVVGLHNFKSSWS